MQFLFGTWSCTHVVGDFSGKYTTTFALALEDRWLKQTQDFPATQDEGPTRTEYFLSHDARIPQWVRFGSHSNGQYYGMVGKRAKNVWSWSYVLPGSAGSSVWTKKSAIEYTIDGPTYPEGGRMVTEHHACGKAS